MWLRGAVCTLDGHEPAERLVRSAEHGRPTAAALAGRAMRDGPLNLTQRVAAATVVQVVGKAAALLFSLLSIRLATNYLGVDGYGDYAIVVTIASLVFVFGEFGLTVLLARELAKHPERVDETAGTVLFLRMVSAAAIMALSFAIVPFLPYSTIVRQGLLIAIAGSMIGLVGIFPNSFFQVHLRLERAALAEVFMRLTALLLMVVVVALDWGFLSFVACTAVAWVVSFAMSFCLLRPFWHPRVRFEWAEVRRVVGRAVPVGLVAVLGLLHFKIDAVLLSLLKPPADVGIYTLAYSVIEQALVLPTLLVAAVFPILSRFVVAGNPSALDVVDKMFRFLTLLGIAAAATVFVLAAPLVRILSNESFGQAVTVLRILAFALIPLFATVAFANLLLSMDSLRLVVGASVIGIVANVALNLYLIPKYATTGAAAATVFSETLALVLIATAARVASPSLPLTTAIVIRLLLVAGATGAALVLTAGHAWWFGLLSALTACLAASLALRVATIEDLRLLLERRPVVPND